jgi:hypothetical protein
MNSGILKIVVVGTLATVCGCASQEECDMHRAIIIELGRQIGELTTEELHSIQGLALCEAQDNVRNEHAAEGCGTPPDLTTSCLEVLGTTFVDKPASLYLVQSWN